MRRHIRRTALLLGTTAALAACGDAPTAPRAVVDAPPPPNVPNEVVATSGTLVQLGVLSGFANGGVYAINDNGVTAGWNNTGSGAYAAFVRANDGTMTQLASLGGNGSVGLGINDVDAVVGLSYLTGNTTYHAFLSTVTNGVRNAPRDLGALLPTAKSAAYGINATGTVVGFSYDALGRQRAVRWVPPLYVIEDLGTLGGTTGFAYDVNDNGLIVGFSTTAAGQTRAFKWANGTMTNLGGLPGGTSSVAHGVNNVGDIVGWATTSTGVTHAFGVYAAAATNYDMGTGAATSYAYDINDNEQAVGWGITAGANAPLAWLQAITSKDLGTLSTTTSAQAYAINGSGQVVGSSGNSATMWFINANRLPTANCGTYTNKTRNTDITFDGSRSTDPDGDILNYSWNFGDGTTGTGVKPVKRYTTAGTYTVKLVVTDWRGGASTQVQTTIKIL